MTFSTFDAYPGLLIWHSHDQVNWQPLAPALKRNIGSVSDGDRVRLTDDGLSTAGAPEHVYDP